MAEEIAGGPVTRDEVAALRQRVAELETAAARFRTAADNTYDWEYWLSPAGQLLYCSPSCQRITGYTPGEFQADPDLLCRLLHPDDQARFREHIAADKAAGAPMEIEFRIVRRDGAVRWIGHACQAVVDAAGQYQGRRASNREITDRKEAEAAVQASAQHLRNVLDSLFAFVAVLTPDGIVTEINRAALTAANLRMDEVLGKSFADADWWSYSRTVQAQIRDAINRAAHGEPSRFDVSVRLGPGNFAVIDFMLTPMRDDTGKITHLVPSAILISDRKRLEEELRSATALAEQRRGMQAAVFAGLNDPVLMYDADGWPLQANAAAVALLGADPTGFDAQQFIALLNARRFRHTDGRPLTLDEMPYRRALNGETVRAQVCQLTTPHGRDVTIEANASLLHVDGRVRGVVVVWRDISDRKRVDEELHRRAQEWQITFDAIGDAVWILDAEQRIVRCNQAALAFTGRTREELIGRHCWEIVHGTTGPIADCPDRRMHQSRRRETMELAIGDRWQQVTVDPLFGEKGELIGAVHSLRDITAFKQAEVALRLASTYHRSLIQVSPDPLITIGLTGKITDVNSATEATTGYARAELIGSDFASYFTEPDLARAGLAQVLREGAVRDYPLAVRRRDGAVRALLCNAAVYHDETGSVLGVFAVGHDITESQRAEAALRQAHAELEQRVAERTAELQESEKRFRTLFEQAAVGVAQIATATGRFVRINQAYCDVVRYTPAEMLQLTWQEITAAEDLPVDLGFMQQLVAGKIREYSMEKRYHRKDGGLVWVRLSVSPMWAPGERPDYHIAVVRDITLRKQAEAALQRTNRALRAVTECGEAMLRATNEADLLQEVCRIVVSVHGDRMAWVGVAETDARKTVRPVAQAGVDAGYLQQAKITWADTPRGRGPIGTAIRTRQVVFCRDVRTDSRFAPWRKSALERGYLSCLALPLIVGDQRLGALSIYGPVPDAFDEAEQSLMQSLANDLAYGISALRSQADRQRLEAEVLRVSEMERQRLGRDLHDGLAQYLVALSMTSSTLKQKLAGRDQPTAALAGKIADQSRQALQMTHDLAKALYPTSLQISGLSVALQEMAANVQDLFGMRCQYQPGKEVRIADENLVRQLFRIAQEAVYNAAKHSRGKLITISLTESARHITLTVKDDGRWVPPAKAAASDMGISIMRYRAGLIGAELQIDGSRGKGTTLTCTVRKPTP